MDGAVARLLKVSGTMGKELDSLADMVSFGVVPGSVVFHLLENSSLASYSFIALVIPSFSAYRLAKFNIDERQTDSFIGLPTPANCLVFISIPLITTFQPESIIASVIVIPEVIIALSIILSLALISEIPLFALKFKNLKFSENKIRFIFLGLTVVLLAILHFSAIPLIVLIYLLLSTLFKQKSNS
jgi:CDP-diacylglycerol--serine O-phosphatidyltransferase